MKWVVDQRWLATARLLAASGLMLSAEEWDGSYGFNPTPEWVVEEWRRIWYRRDSLYGMKSQLYDLNYEEKIVYGFDPSEKENLNTRWYRDMTLALMAEIYCTTSPP